MTYYVGLDVSNKETSICIMSQQKKIVKEAKVKSEPEAIHKYLTKHGYHYERIGLEAGALSNWLVKGLKKLGMQVICIDSRTMAALLSVKVNKTDKNDARAIADAMRTENYKEVHIKSDESVKTNSLLTTRNALVQTKLDLENTVRGILKTYGIKLKKNIKSYASEVRNVNAFNDFIPEGKPAVDLEIFEPLLKVLEEIIKKLEELEEKLKQIAKEDKICKRLMTMDGVGPIIALTFKCEIDDPTRFKNSRSVGAYLGMTPKQYSSGEKIVLGRVSKCGSSELRALLITGANIVINKCKKKSKMRSWGLKKKKELGNPKAKVALARKMAVIMHRMWINEKDFDSQMQDDEFCLEEKRIEQEIDIEKEKKQVKAMRKAKANLAKNVA